VPLVAAGAALTWPIGYWLVFPLRMARRARR